MSQLRPDGRHERSGLRWSAWNLLLLVPLLTLVTPWFDSAEPRLFGMPYFYWAQFASVPVGVSCVALVFVMTRDRERSPASPDLRGVDGSDPGSRR